MKHVTIFMGDREAVITSGAGPQFISLEMAECFIRQYQLTGWTEDPDNKNGLFHFYKNN